MYVLFKIFIGYLLTLGQSLNYESRGHVYIVHFLASVAYTVAGGTEGIHLLNEWISSARWLIYD